MLPSAVVTRADRCSCWTGIGVAHLDRAAQGLQAGYVPAGKAALKSSNHRLRLCRVWWQGVPVRVKRGRRRELQASGRFGGRLHAPCARLDARHRSSGRNWISIVPHADGRYQIQRRRRGTRRAPLGSAEGAAALTRALSAAARACPARVNEPLLTRGFNPSAPKNERISHSRRAVDRIDRSRDGEDRRASRARG